MNMRSSLSLYSAVSVIALVSACATPVPPALDDAPDSNVVPVASSHEGLVRGTDPVTLTGDRVMYEGLQPSRL
jgi:hypothetical protein